MAQTWRCRESHYGWQSLNLRALWCLRGWLALSISFYFGWTRLARLLPCTGAQAGKAHERSFISVFLQTSTANENNGELTIQTAATSAGGIIFSKEERIMAVVMTGSGSGQQWWQGRLDDLGSNQTTDKKKKQTQSDQIIMKKKKNLRLGTCLHNTWHTN